MKPITLNNAEYFLPESWQEVRKEDIPSLIRLLAAPATGDVYREVLRITLGISPKPWSKFIKFHFDSTDVSVATIEENALALHELLTIINWLWRTPLDIKPFEFIQVGKERWLLPDASLEYVSWGELTDALIHYELFTSEGSVESLDILIASVCRPARSLKDRHSPSWNGDPRVPYNSFIAKSSSSRIAHFAHLSDAKTTILLYFGGIANSLFSKFKLSDGKEAEPEEYSGQNFLKNTYNLAEKQIFGDLEKTRSTNCYEILNFLEEHKKDNEALIAEYEKNKPQ